MLRLARHEPKAIDPKCATNRPVCGESNQVHQNQTCFGGGSEASSCVLPEIGILEVVAVVKQSRAISVVNCKLHRSRAVHVLGLIKSGKLVVRSGLDWDQLRNAGVGNA